MSSLLENDRAKENTDKRDNRFLTPLFLVFLNYFVKKTLLFLETALNYWTLNTSFNTIKTQYIFYSLKVLMGG